MNELELRHYGAIPLELDRSREYEQRIHFKPRGLWVSVVGEDDWPNWCEAESFSMDRLVAESVISLKGGASILHLETAQQVVEFGKEFAAELVPGVGGYIDWRLVAQKYDGIIIAPYQWSLRMSRSVGWYYSWDVASGCIWGLGVVEVSETK